MKLTTKQGKWKAKEIQALIVPIDKKKKAPKGLPKFAEQLLKQAIKQKQFAGKARQLISFKLPAKDLRLILFVGVGDAKELKAKDLGELVAQAVRKAQSQKVTRAGIWFSDMLAKSYEDVEQVAQVIAEYAALGAYNFNQYLKKKEPQLRSFIVYVENRQELKAVQAGVKTGATIANIVNESRDLANRPSNELTPKDLAQYAKSYSEIKVKVLGEKEMEKLGMGAILGVSRGSAQEAQFIIAEYWGAAKSDKPYVLVGKGVTFDTGGISIKPSNNMDEMKTDMAGGAAALGIVRCAAALKLPLNVVALIPASENMPGHNAYKPGDILKAKDGSTIEVLNTDAEGRLLLADALVYARDYKPATVIDLATLTGACAYALHDSAAGMFTKEDKLAEDLTAAGVQSGDQVWRLPLPDAYKELVKSKVADIANVATVNFGGAITAAVFLQHFVDDKYPWAHLDIAGMAWSKTGKKYLTSGSTGAGVRVVVEWLRKQASE